jgi:hypothetical protein
MRYEAAKLTLAQPKNVGGIVKLNSFYSRDIDYRCLLYKGASAKLLSLKPRKSIYCHTILQQYDRKSDLLLLSTMVNQSF